MLKRSTSVVLLTAIICTLGSPAFAGNRCRPDTKSDLAEALAEPGAAAAKQAQPNERLRLNILKLVAEAEAGKVAPIPRSQIQPAKRNNLSKGAKIAIGVGIAVAVVAIVLIVNKPRVTGSAVF
jgi:hypothetical protein